MSTDRRTALAVLTAELATMERVLADMQLFAQRNKLTTINVRLRQLAESTARTRQKIEKRRDK